MLVCLCSTKGLFSLEVLVTVAVALGLQERRAAPPDETALKAAPDGLSMLASVATEVAGGPGVRNDPQRPTTPPAGWCISPQLRRTAALSQSRGDNLL